MLTDTALRNLQSRSKPYKVADRDGMYVAISPAGTVAFTYDYRLHGQREMLTIGRYGVGGISLAEARERLADARRAVSEGRSPAIEKQREKHRLARAKTFGEFAVQWLKGARMADTTRSMRKCILDRNIAPTFERRLLSEISADDLRSLCQRIKGRDAPATAVHARDIVKQIYAFASLHGEKTSNPADDAGAASIATFVPKDRALSPTEIRLLHRQMEMVATYPTTRLALRMILLTLVRKSELIQATWDEVDFDAAVWTIPKSRMKARRPHNVYLHYVFDLWVQRWRRHHANGDVIVVRYADDSVAGFERKADVHRFLEAFKERLAKFGLALNEEKTRVLEFGRFAIQHSAQRGLRRPQTFDFWGFTHICATKWANGRFTVKRLTIAKRMRATLKALRQTLNSRKHEPIPVIGKWLRRVVQGYFNYHAVPGNDQRLSVPDVA